MEHKIIPNLFKSHNNARDYLAENPNLLIPESELVGVEFRLLRGQADILLKKGDTFYLVEVKTKESLYSARKQLFAYGRVFSKSKIPSKYKNLKYIVVKIQKYLGTDVYVYDDLDDVMSRENNYQEIHDERLEKTKLLPEVIEKFQRNHKIGMDKRAKKLKEEKHL